MSIMILVFIVLAIAILMTMTGRGGGNFYVLALALSGMGMHQAAASGQFILMLTSLAGMLIFQKNKMIDWKLALVIDPPTDIMAFVGGYLSDYIGGTELKLVFSVLLIIAGIIMLIKVEDKAINKEKRFGYWHREFQGHHYTVNLWLAIPVTALVGLFSGALGISGGSFKVPLMVLFCGVPMRIAVGTSSAMVAATALMGFTGHLSQGHFDPHTAIILAIAALIGGLIGGKFALKTKPKNLKKIFALTTIAASVIMFINALTT
mgnify:CR=1 FL=1